MIRTSSFKKNTNFFHINFDYIPTGYFKKLDWISLQEKSHLLSQQFQIEIHALVLMDTHIHLLIESLGNKENFFVNHLYKNLNSQEINESYCEPIKNYSQYLNVYKYIYRNPIEAKIVEKCEDYPFSSLSTLLGKGPCHCLIVDKLNLIQNPLKVLKWLNSDTDYKASKLKDLRQASSALI